MPFHAIYYSLHDKDDWHYYTGVTDSVERATRRSHSILGSFLVEWPTAQVALREHEKAMDARSTVPKADLAPLMVKMFRFRGKTRFEKEESEDDDREENGGEQGGQELVGVSVSSPGTSQNRARSQANVVHPGRARKARAG